MDYPHCQTKNIKNGKHYHQDDKAIQDYGLHVIAIATWVRMQPV